MIGFDLLATCRFDYTFGFPEIFTYRRLALKIDLAAYHVSTLRIGVALVGNKKTGKGRRKIGRKKRRMRAKIRHRKK